MHGDAGGRKELRAPFRLDRNRSGDDGLLVRYVSAHLVGGWERVWIGACGTIRGIWGAQG